MAENKTTVLPKNENFYPSIQITPSFLAGLVVGFGIAIFIDYKMRYRKN